MWPSETRPRQLLRRLRALLRDTKTPSAGESPRPLDPDEQDQLLSFQQGDVIVSIDQLVIADDEGRPRSVSAPLGVVIISQTCDVVLPERLVLQVAKRVNLPAKEAEEARDGKRPRYVQLPAIDEAAFADLEIIATVAKRFVVRQHRQPGVDSDDDVRNFARAVARKFGRFAFPDDVTPFLRPLEEIISSRVRRGSTPEASVLDQVVELRIEASNGWNQGPPYDLILIVIVKPGTVPMFPDDQMPDLPEELGSWLRTNGQLTRTSAQIAQRLVASRSDVERYWLWQAIAEAWAAKCVPKQKREGSAEVSIEGQLLSADEYPLSRMRRSEQLDLDHLSGPVPR